MAKEEDVAESQEYEEEALRAIEKDAPDIALVYSQLAVAATIREAVFVLAEIFTIDDDDDDDEDEEVEDDK